MQSILLTFLIAAALLSPAHAATRVFILSGQSNMDGRGKKSDLVGPLARYAQPQQDVRIAYSNSTLRGPFATDGFQPLQPGFSVPPGSKRDTFRLPGATFGPEVSFGRAMADALPNDKIVLIKFSEGGTSLHNDWKLDKPGGLYEQAARFVTSSLKTLSDNGESCELSGVIWLQGESDASLPPGEYQKLLTALIARCRTDLGDDTVPFVVVEVFDNHKRDKVRAGQRATTQAVANTLFVSADHLVTSDNGTHFDAASQITLGQRIAAALIPKIKKEH